MKLTKAQEELLARLENGCEVTLQDDYYTVVDKNGAKVDKVWPTTFYGLFDAQMVERQENGNYTITDEGLEVWRATKKARSARSGKG